MTTQGTAKKQSGHERDANTTTTFLRRFAVLTLFIALSVVSIVNTILSTIALYKTAQRNMTPIIATSITCGAAIIVGVALYLAIAIKRTRNGSLVVRTYNALGVRF